MRCSLVAGRVRNLYVSLARAFKGAAAWLYLPSPPGRCVPTRSCGPRTPHQGQAPPTASPCVSWRRWWVPCCAP